jgi:RHS repeat-associated protein
LREGASPRITIFGAQRVAMQDASSVTYLHGDHLGSTSVTSGAISSEQTYYAFGAVRTTNGTLPTDYTFTGQKIDASDGLMYYSARYYDAAIGRFIQPDSIIEDWHNPQYLNRYAYVRNNPVRYTDPTGNRVCEDADCRTTITTAQVNKIVKENEADKGDHHQPVVSKSNQQPSNENSNNSNMNSSNYDYCNMARCGMGSSPQSQKKDDWENLGNVLIWPEVVEMNVTPVVLTTTGTFFFATTVYICAQTVGVGCAVAVTYLVPTGVAAYVSAAFTGNAAREFDVKIWNNTFGTK